MKAKILRVTDRVILNMLGPGFHEAYECVGNPLPEDSYINGMKTDFRHPHEIWLRIVSKTFPDIDSGMQLEFLEPPVFEERRKP